VDSDAGGARAGGWFRIHALERSGFQLAEFRAEETCCNYGFRRPGYFLEYSAEFFIARLFNTEFFKIRKQCSGSGNSDTAVFRYCATQLAGIEFRCFQFRIQNGSCGESSINESSELTDNVCGDTGGQRQCRRFSIEPWNGRDSCGRESWRRIEHCITNACQGLKRRYYGFL
jgi:hypothetical protein